MNPEDEKLGRSLELLKAGFDNAQGRISFIDTKVGIAVGLLVVFLPVPFLIVAWLTGLQGDVATNIYGVCRKCWLISGTAALFLLLGMVADVSAILCGIFCLTPRGPKGHEKVDAFHNEWQAAALFPIHGAKTAAQFLEHLKVIKAGIDLPFQLEEYDYQLRQVGTILDAKLQAMRNCFWWLRYCLACYGIAILCATYIGLTLVAHAGKI